MPGKPQRELARRGSKTQGLLNQFTKFLQDVEESAALLTHASMLLSSHPL